MDEIRSHKVDKSRCGFFIWKFECLHLSCHCFGHGITWSCMLEIAVL